MRQVHGHEVIDLIMSLGDSFARESLRDEIINHFGEETTFFSCSTAGMTADEVIQFFESKGKFAFGEDGRVRAAFQRCEH